MKSMIVDFGKMFVVSGGPYRHKPDHMVGVKMAAEINLPCVVDCPTEDFDVPDTVDFSDALTKTLMLIMSGAPVYVGCMGGIGRTGLMMAALTKVQFALRNDRVSLPISCVRTTFHPHAVETQHQKEFIANLYVGDQVRMVRAFIKATGDLSYELPPRQYVREFLDWLF